MEEAPVVQVARLAEEDAPDAVSRALDGWHGTIVEASRRPVRRAREILMES